MRFTTYSKYHPELADAVNLQALLDQLGDFLLQSGFAGGTPVVLARRGGRGRPVAGVAAAGDPPGADGFGPVHPEMLKALRGESTGDAERDRQVERELSELLDRIVQRLIDEGYLNVGQAAADAAGLPVHVRPRRPGPRRRAAGAVQPHREGHRLPRLQDAARACSAASASRASARTTRRTSPPASRRRA